jgi:DNA-binding PadR family transcriptional regulator
MLIAYRSIANRHISLLEHMKSANHISQAFLHGIVKLFVLHQAGRAPVYGGVLSKSLHTLGYRISPGSLYPLLHTLEKERLLRCRQSITRGRLRKYYELTDKGHAALAAARTDLAGLVQEIIFDGKFSPSGR